MTDNGPWFGEDKQPEGVFFIEVYGLTRATGKRKHVWESLPAELLQPWHLWRYRYEHDSKDMAKARRIRKKYNVVTCGFLYCEDEDGGFKGWDFEKGCPK